MGECLDGIGVSYWVSIGYGTDLIIDGQNVLKVGFDYSVRVWEKMDVNHVQEIKLDLKANITVSDMPTLNQDQRGWQHKQNAGNQAHLASAVNIIRQNNIMQSIRVMRLFDYDFNRYQYATMLSVYLYHLLKSYDVYVDLIEGPYELCWDNWDENGNWYGGTDFVYDITIYAGGAISTAFVKADSL